MYDCSVYNLCPQTGAYVVGCDLESGVMTIKTPDVRSDPLEMVALESAEHHYFSLHQRHRASKPFTVSTMAYTTWSQKEVVLI